MSLNFFFSVKNAYDYHSNEAPKLPFPFSAKKDTQRSSPIFLVLGEQEKNGGHRYCCPEFSLPFPGSFIQLFSFQPCKSPPPTSLPIPDRFRIPMFPYVQLAIH